MTTTNLIDLKTILNWSEPKRLRTTQGERDLLRADPTQEFSALWKANKEALKKLGISWAKKTVTNEQTGQPIEVWEVLWWRPISAEEAAAKAASLEASKAINANVSVPAPKGLEYLGYQLAGIKYASGREGTLIADEMGLGKTIQAIGLINSDPTIKSVLIVCPASIKLNWGRELRKWLTRKLSIQIVGSGIGWSNAADVTIVNYEMLSKFAPEIVGRTWDLAVIDESHRIKNPKAQRTKVFAQIKARRRVCMTGTPILNRPVELWTSLYWLDPKRWDKRKSYFEKRYCGAFQSKWGWENGGATHLDELQEVLRTSVMVRRLKRDVLTELPPKQRQVIELEGDSNARAAAKAELAKFKALLAEAGIKDDQSDYAAAVAKLAAGSMASFEQMSRVRHDTAMAKVPLVAEFAQEILEGGDTKLVIFGHHQDVLDYLMDSLKEYNPVRLDGKMSPTAKQASVDAFQKDPSVRVFVGSTLASGEGITLTASSHEIFAELDWTPGRVAQAEDRCHRIGQFDSVLVQHLVLEGSLDAYIADLMVEKQNIADKALDKEIKPIEVKKAATEIEVKQPELKLEGPLSAEQVVAVHYAMKMLAGVCDGAQALDGAGFNKLDTEFGKSLANAPYLSQKQAGYAVKLAVKYHRQLPKELVATIVKKANT